MSYNRVRAGSLYRYEPVPLDRFHPPYNIEANDIVRVVNLPSCPKANTMGHAHVEHLGGEFAGLVCTNSLVPLTAEEKSYVVRVSHVHFPLWKAGDRHPALPLLKKSCDLKIGR